MFQSSLQPAKGPDTPEQSAPPEGPYERTCPAGHRLGQFDGLRCPVCGRLVPRRYARACPNGHLIGGRARYCPICGEPVPIGPSDGTIFVVALIAIAVLVLLSVILGIPRQMSEMAASAWEWLTTFLPELLGVGA